ASQRQRISTTPAGMDPTARSSKSTADARARGGNHPHHPAVAVRQGRLDPGDTFRLEPAGDTRPSGRRWGRGRLQPTLDATL
ncbi:MAG: hypothetical protein LBJ08_11415, partial [Bifidobacteriaceae bacterium]|nr:hypothetical protein [Bifidobacteriaceae bacterium]